VQENGQLQRSGANLAIGVEPALLLEYRATGKNIDALQKEHDKIELQLEQLGKLVKEGQIIEAGFNFHERPVLEFEASAGSASEDQAASQAATNQVGIDKE
jgi:hypothetical protein